MSHTDNKVSIPSLKINLKRAESLCDIIGYDKIIDKAKSNPGLIAKTFGTPNYIYQCYIESLFRTIKYYKIKYPNPNKKFKKDLLNPDTDNPTLTEIEVAAKLAPYFKIKPEYDIIQSQPKSKESKNLDLCIEDESNGEKVLIEIATKDFDYENYEDNCKNNGKACFHYPGGKGGRGYTIKNGCYNKMEEQLGYIQSKKLDLGYPLILLFKDECPFPFCSQSNQNYEDILSGLYGQEYIQFTTRVDKTREFKRARYENGFYNENDIDFISEIGIYQLKFFDNYRIVGQLYKPINPPQYEMSLEFKSKFEKALFGCITNVDL
jgi:hypothetical protein